MNVSRLHASAAPQVQRVVKDGEERDADFLALRLLNKRSRVKLSPDSLKLDPLPGKGVLFTTANILGCFAAAICSAAGEHSIIVSGLAELRSTFTSSDSDAPIPFTPRCTIPLPAQPNILAFTSSNTRLVVGLLSGSTVVYDAAVISTPGLNAVQPLHAFPSPTNRPPKDILVNPGDIPELVAVYYESEGPPDAALVELLDVQKLQIVGGWQSGGTPETTPASVCWSPKGKQIAIGMQSGDIVSFAPGSTSTVKTMVPRPSSLPSEKLLSAFWLSNPDFYGIFTAPEALSPDADQTHMLVSLDAKAGTVTEVKLGAPFLPFPGMRPPGAFTILLRQWEPTKYMLFVGDSSSSDVGLIGCIEVNGQEQWAHLTLEETSTPSMPLDQEMMDTVLLGLALDVTNTEPYTHKTASGEDQVLPPPPILYAYASDGTVIGWHLLNTAGKPYPGMKTPTAPAIQQIPSESMETEAAPAMAASASTPAAADQAMSGQHTPAALPFGQLSSTSAFGQIGFGQPSTFGQPSGFGSTSDTSAFGTKPALGFGAFANAGPSKFGQASGFVSNAVAPQTPASPALASPMAVSTSTSGMGQTDADMSIDTATDAGFGSLSLGGASDSADADKSKAAGNSMFGSFASTPAASPSTASAFGSAGSSGGLLKPATGFGVFGGQSSGFGFDTDSSNNTSTSTSTPSPAFGSSGFTAAKPATPSPAFGSSGFGSKPAFGQSAFGQSAFGQSAFGQTSAPQPAFASPAITPASGGFAAFAGGTSAFSTTAKQSTESKSKEEEKKSESEAKASEQPEPATAPAQPSTPTKSASPFGTPNTPNTFPSTPTKPASGGAFSNLVSSPSGFGKLDSGFGAFGSSAAPSSSPFFNPPKAPTTPTAFGSTPPALSTTSSAPSTPTSAAKPIFGAPSSFGQPSALGAAAASGQNKPTFGASSSFGSSSAFGQSAFSGLGNNSASHKGFGNFSAGGGGFGAFSGGKKSFSELLKSETDEKKEKEKEQTAPKGSSLPSLSKNIKDKAGPSTSSQEQPKRTSVFGVPLDKKTTETAVTKKKEDTTSAPRGDASGDEEDAEHHEEGDDEDFLSDEFEEDEEGEEGDEDEGDEDEREEDEEGVEVAEAVDGFSGLVLPDSSEAATLPPGPTIHLTDSSPPASPEKKKESTLKDDTTTPPGSPDKQPSPPAVASPTPVTATPSSPFGLLGRPSTQPKRSSPLASAPINRDSDDDTTEKLPLPLLSRSPASAEAAASTTPSASKPSTTASAAASEQSTSRPKTPPLQGIFGPVPAMPKPAPFTLAPSTPPPSSLFGSPQASSSPKPDAGPSKASPVFSAPPLKPGTPTPKTDSAAPPLFPSLAPGGSLFSQKAAPSPPAKSEGSAPTMSFGAAPSGPLFAPKPSATPGSSFAQTTSSPTPPSVFGQPRGFGQKPTTPSQATFTPPPGNFFSQKPAAKSPVGSPSPAPKQAADTLPAPGAALASMSQMDPLARMAEGMEKEAANLLIAMARELEVLKQEAVKQNARMKEYYKMNNVSRTTFELGDSSKWALGDVREFSRLLHLLEKEFVDLKQIRAGYSKAIRELETAMLKATMRKEEIVRFSRANSDAEFTKMLKSRTLGPEHLETQAQLRRGIRLLRDRIQKIEEHLLASKKRLSQLKMGKAGLRPPSLDTINRTYRNIDIVVNQQADDVARLSQRLSKLDLTMSPRRTAIDFRSSPGRRISETTPSVAATTAAALNAERAAQRLKSALLKVRKEPLLNKQAADAPAPPSERDFVTKEPKKEFALSSSLFNSDGGATQTPSLNLPSLDTADTALSSTPSHGHRQRESRHGKSVQLKKSNGSLATSATSPPAGFSWGPLPAVTGPSKLPFSLTLKKDDNSGSSTLPFSLTPRKDVDKPFSLSNSWVTDDFEKK